MLVEDVVSLSELMVSGGTVWWIERRASEGGRQVIVAAGPDGDPKDALPAGWSARSRVHEYGGGAFAVHGETVFFADDASQRLHRLELGGDPVPITPEPPQRGAWRYADTDMHPDGRWLVCVRERHRENGEVVNDVVAVSTMGEGEPVVLASGHDFFAAPRTSPDGRRLAWLTWDHPNMPWDGTELWVADIGSGPALGPHRRVAGGPDESISQPRWSPDAILHFVSDSTGWWNLYAADRPLAPMEAEFTGPDWIFGQSTYAFLGERLVAAFTSGGTTRLGVVQGGGVREVPTAATVISSVRPFGEEAVVAIAASPIEEPAVVRIELAEADTTVLRRSRARPLPRGAVSVPTPISYASAGGRTAHAYYYPPHLDGWDAPAGELPPLLVVSHGGPTSATSAQLDASLQFWTSRGFAVVDVDYRGSTGYGRDYRRLIEGQWGVVDVDDCVHAARHLADRGLADPNRLLIRGRSAGGLTTLCALAFHGGFAAGAISYGVADLESLAAETHKFEAHYLDRLVGPLPAARDVYRARSPVHAAHRLRTPIIIFQGLDDRVVPPSQAEMLVEGLQANRVPFAYVTFEGEGHGFRKAETITRAIESELHFYGRVLGFDPADSLPFVPIHNLDRP